MNGAKERIIFIKPLSGCIILGLIALIASWLWFDLILQGLTPTTGDENISLFASRMYLQGLVPHRDFFFAHTQWHLFFYMLPQALGFQSLISLKIFNAVAYFIAGLVSIVGLRKITSAEIAVVSVLFYLFSYEILVQSTLLASLSWSQVFTCFSLACLARNHSKAAIVFASLATLLTLYYLPLALGILIALTKSHKKIILREWLLFFAIIIGGFLLEWVMTGSTFLEQVILFHFKKPRTLGLPLSQWADFFISNIFYFLSISAGIILYVFSYKKKDNQAWHLILNAVLSSVVFFLLLFSMTTMTFTHYLLFLFPMGIYFTGFLLQTLKNEFQSGQYLKVALGILIFVSSYWVASLSLSKIIFPENQTQYTYPDKLNSKSLLPFFSWSQFLFNPIRQRDWVYLPIQHYLWHSSQGFQNFKSLNHNITKQCGSACTIWGDYSLVPLTLYTLQNDNQPVKLWQNLLDTSIMPYLANKKLIEQQLSITPLPDLVISNNERGIFVFKEAQYWLQTNFKIVNLFNDPYRGEFVLWVPKKKDNLF